MTRINANINPKNLHRVHLVAELREITMVPAALRRSLRTRSVDSILKGIPKKFTLNSGHVTYFYNKQQFLLDRFDALCDRMEELGYSPDRTRRVAFLGLDPIWYGRWQSSLSDDALVQERIDLRISQKPHLYK